MFGVAGIAAQPLSAMFQTATLEIFIFPVRILRQHTDLRRLIGLKHGIVIINKLE